MWRRRKVWVARGSLTSEWSTLVAMGCLTERLGRGSVMGKRKGGEKGRKGEKREREERKRKKKKRKITEKKGERKEVRKREGKKGEGCSSGDVGCGGCRVREIRGDCVGKRGKGRERKERRREKEKKWKTAKKEESERKTIF